jgi:hypothetical protein
MARSIDEDEAAVERFVREAAETEAVWGIRTPRGFALLDADSEYAVAAMLFFSAEADAATAAGQFSPGGSAADRLTWSGQATVDGTHYQSGQPARIELFDFLYRWLANMPRDHLCAGPNWSLPDLIGCSIRCSELVRRLEERLQMAGRLAGYRARYEQD